MSWSVPTPESPMHHAGGHDDPAALAERLLGLAAFLPIFGEEGFRFGSWYSQPGTAPVYDFSVAAGRFIDEAYRLGWVLPGFDWGAWAGTAEARRLLEDPGAVAGADPGTLAKLLTLHIRQERFCEGHLAGAFEGGHLTAILRRMHDLHANTKHLRELELRTRPEA